MRNYFMGKFAIFVRGDDVLLDESGLIENVCCSRLDWTVVYRT